MRRIRRAFAFSAAAMIATMVIVACTGDEPQPEQESAAPTEDLPGHFDADLPEPFCDMTTSSLELPSVDAIDYNAEQSAPDVKGSVATFTCLVLPSEADQFEAAVQGRPYAVVRSVLSIADGEMTSDPSLPSIPVPFNAADLDWNGLGEDPDTYTRTMNCPTDGDCEAGTGIAMSVYEQTFAATHANIYIELTITSESPIDSAGDLPDPATYALSSYECYATRLVQTLPQE